MVEDIFPIQIKGGGLVVCGIVSSGPIRVMDQVTIVTRSRDVKAEVMQIQAESRKIHSAERGDRVGLLLQGDGLELLERGHVVGRASR
jgi:selenocysteine-specific translation elongation factor